MELSSVSRRWVVIGAPKRIWIMVKTGTANSESTRARKIGKGLNPDPSLPPFLLAPSFFFRAFAFVPTAGKQHTTYAICATARGSKAVVKVGIGSATSAGNRK